MSGLWASVVVPVYKTEEWLPEALASIDRQECREQLEVIVVDDGSPDNSGRIAQEYAQQRPNVRYVRQENAGLGAARNHGVRLATGKYLAFLDSDDIYPPDGLHHLLRLADAHDAQIVVGDMHGLPPRRSPAWRRELMAGPRVIKGLDDAPDLAGNPSACNKVFRRDLVTALNVEFSEGTAFEDVLFTLPLLMRADRTLITPHLAYLYRTRGDGSSIMDARGEPSKIFQHLGIMERLADQLGDVTDGTRWAVRRWIAYMQLHYTWWAGKALDDEQLGEFLQRMAALFADIPVDVASEFVRHARAGIRAAGVYEQDLASVRDPRFSGPLRVRHGQVYAGHPQFDQYQNLLRIHKMHADFTSTEGDSHLTIRGKLHLWGIVAADGEIRDDLLLEVGDTVTRQPIVIDRLVENGVHWSCQVPLDQVGPGRHRLRLVVRDHGREFVVPTGDETWGSPAVSLTDGRTAWIWRVGQGPQLVVADTRLTKALQAPVRAGGYTYRRGSAALRRTVGRAVKKISG